MKPTFPKILRCAVYTRKSTEHNLDLAFNSLDAQREACEAYIKSQEHEGWRLVPDHFDDGAFSGASLDRPALQSLIDLIKTKRVDVVVVYKVDRLTRSLSDFAKLVELFDAHDVSFVSVTQSFNTTSSMGRLTLNVLLSFAQFEREVISERVRDKIAASKRKGLWLGGPVPLGYKSQHKKLEIVPAEADLVRLIFETYLSLGSVKSLMKYLDEAGILPMDRVCKSGREIKGRRWTFGHLNYILKNRCYIGELVHNGAVYQAEHEAIIERYMFDQVQEYLARQTYDRRSWAESNRAVLKGLLFDSAGHKMSPSHSNKKGIRYRYYVSQALLQGREKDAGEVTRVSAPEIEDSVMKSVSDMALNAASEDGINLLELVERVTLHKDRIVIRRTHNGQDGNSGDDIEVPFIAQKSMHKGILHQPEAHRDMISDEAREILLRSIARARRWYQTLLYGTSTIDDIAQTESLTPRYIRRLMTLAFLSPKLIRAIADGQVIASCTPSRLTEALPREWSEQERLFLVR